MPLTLLTGPANAAKAGVAFERLQTLRARDPLLVVPTMGDVDHYRAELAESGFVLAPPVVTFDALVRLLARAAGVGGRVLGPVARERVVRAVVSDARLERLARSSRTAGFSGALAGAFAELERGLVSPGRLESAIAAWAGEDPAGRHAQARELAALYRAYRRRLAALGAHDPEGYAWAALDALRRDPAAWQRRPVLFYGFDDLTATQLDAVEALVRNAESEVLVSLPYEPGRAAFAGRASTVAILAALADRHLELPERSEHYAPASREPLHFLERALFEPDAGVIEAGRAVRLLEAGGERAEAEMVGAELLELLSSGVAAPEIAVLVRGGSGERELMARVLETYGVPVSRHRRFGFAHTRLGAGLLALARSATAGGDAAALLRWLRTPGCLDDPEPADRLEQAVRRGRVTTLASARAAWRGPGQPLHDIDAVAEAARRGPLDLLRTLLTCGEATWRACHHRRARRLDAEEALDARTCDALRRTLEELEPLVATDPRLLRDAAAALEALASVEVVDPAGGDGVLLADPLDIRARRFRAVLCVGLQDGRFPRRPPPDPFLGDEDRRALARASGLRLPLREDVVADERHLFYAVCSRPQERLVLSWCSSTEEGDPLQPSPFLAEVCRLFTPALRERRRRRLLAEVTWSEQDAPTPVELRRSRAARTAAPEPGPLAAPRSGAVLADLAGREVESARGLETFGLCGMRWVVEFVLRPERFEPDPDPLWRGSLAHATLEEVLRRLREQTGSARLTPDRLETASAILDAVVEERARAETVVARRAALTSLAADLRRYLREESAGGAGWEPARLEWGFGAERDGDPPLVLSDGTRVSGRVDRIDVEGDEAIVRDYKSTRAVPLARWPQDGSLQAGLYALAARRLLGLRVRAAVYQPLARDLRPRGAVAESTPGDYVGNDVVAEPELEAALAGVEARAVAAADGIRRGHVVPCPGSCSSQGCLYPGICRAAGEPPARDEAQVAAA